MGRMRTARVVVLGAMISFLAATVVLAGAALVGLVAQPGPHQGFEIAAETLAMAMVAIGSAIVYAIVLAFGGRRPAVMRTTIALMAFLVLILAAPAILGMATTDPSDLAGEDELRLLVMFLTVLAIPGLLAIVAQWRIIERHLGQAAGADSPTGSRGG